MKVLIVTWNIYDDELKQYNANCTGEPLIVRHLCEYIGKKEELYLLVGRYSMPPMKLGNVNIIGTEFIAGIGSSINTNAQHIEALLDVFEWTLRTVKPDIVNIHGLGDFAKKCVEKCIAQKIPCVFTAHIFINPAKVIEGYERVVGWEKEMYSIKGIKIIAVSTGIKIDIMRSFPHIPERDIFVIQNGTSIKDEIVPSGLRAKYGLVGKRILVCVGTLIPRKNQWQLVETFGLLQPSIMDNLAIIFCGADKMNGFLQDEITKAGLEDKLIYIGALANQDMKKVYSIADGMIMPSLAEGLSIAGLEMITYGKPVIMFSDVECVDDLNDEKVVCLARERTSQGLADAITQWYEKDWDDDYIKRYAKSFDMETMAQNYIYHYKQLLSETRK